MAASVTREPSLVYIMGDGRSGSTIASIILGNHPDISSVGELRKWPRFRGQPKADNEKQEDYRFWGQVLQRYLVDSKLTDFRHLEYVQGQIGDYGHFPRVFLGWISPELRSEYCAYTGALLEAIRAVSEKGTVVDESKQPGCGYMLVQPCGVEAKIIHLVRDPRGVVWSSAKPDVEHKYKRPIVAAVHYTLKNLMCLLVGWRAPRGSAMRVRYEDLVENPARELGRIGEFLGLSMDPVIDQLEAGEPLWVPHLLDGNRIRHQEEVRLRFDKAWRKEQSWGDRAIAVLFTLPFFLFFGYWNYPYEP